ncbi:MAG: hypothetical protein IKC35_04845 [Clostridia bacterium]|nr:hypothetical protein [Clostridia bacterium]
MAKIKNRYLTLIAWALIWVLWNVLVLVIADLDAVSPNFWCGFAFTEVAFIVVGVLIAFTQVNQKTAIISVYTPYYIVTGVYFALAFILNFIFLFIKSDNVTAAIILNAIVLVFYIVAMIVCYMGFRHINENEKEITTKVSEIRTLEVTVGALAYKTTDIVVKNKINDLKNKIHFSDPMGTSATASAEQDIKCQIDVINDMLSSGVDQAAVIAAIDDAIAKVEIRNKLLMASR